MHTLTPTMFSQSKPRHAIHDITTSSCHFLINHTIQMCFVYLFWLSLLTFVGLCVLWLARGNAPFVYTHGHKMILRRTWIALHVELQHSTIPLQSKHLRTFCFTFIMFVFSIVGIYKLLLMSLIICWFENFVIKIKHTASHLQFGKNASLLLEILIYLLRSYVVETNIAHPII